MRQRHQAGCVRKQRGRWYGMWRVNGIRKSRVLGLVKDMTKSKAREEVTRIIAEECAIVEANKEWRFAEFVIEVYFPFYSRKWKRSTIGVNKNRILMHFTVEFASRTLGTIQRDELQDLLDR